MFYKILTNWYLQENRELPWRKNNIPYFVWLSEIILQQTRVAQGLPYFLAFTEAFPTIFDLAKANENSVLKLWQGLGYYSRARNLHFTAKHIVKEFNGVFPNNYNDLLKLKGVGDYTASAIASICFNENTAVVDGNVYRVLSRYFNIDTPINSSEGKKEFKKLAQSLIDESEPGVYNQAIMDFGALICKPQKPLCNECVLSESCLALKKKTISNLPVKIKKLKIRKRYFNFLVVVTEKNQTIIEERTSNGIWKGLFQFPLIETSKKIDEKELISIDYFTKLFPDNTTISLFNSEEIIHKLSHQHLYTRFWIVKTSKVNSTLISWEKVKKAPVPVLIDNFLTQFLSEKSNFCNFDITV